MKWLTSKRVRYHRCYTKVEGQLEWWQYQRLIYRQWYLWGFPIWSRCLACVDRPMHEFIKKACT